MFRLSRNIQYINVYAVYISIYSMSHPLRSSFLKCEITDPYSIYNIVYGVACNIVYIVYISRIHLIRVLPQTVPAHHLLQSVSTQPKLTCCAGDIAAALIERFDDHPPLEGRNAGLEVTPLHGPELFGKPDFF